MDSPGGDSSGLSKGLIVLHPLERLLNGIARACSTSELIISRTAPNTGSTGIALSFCTTTRLVCALTREQLDQRVELKL